MSSLRSPLGMDLSIYQSLRSTVRIELKTPKKTSFICKVKGFLFDTDDTRVEFTRVEETLFPNDTEENKQGSYITLFKNVKSVEDIKNIIK